jgi:translation initiation factor IF-2
MEQTRVSDLASEFELKNTFVISELKKIGVWVPSSDTTVDQDIANRIRRRLQVLVELEQEKNAPPPPKAKEKKTVAAKPRKTTKKTIKELGKVRKARKVVKEVPEVVPDESPLAASLKPRKGKTSYRSMEPPAEVIETDKIEVISIHDEPVIKKVEATASDEALEAMQPSVEETVLEPTVEAELTTQEEAPKVTAEAAEVVEAKPAEVKDEEAKEPPKVGTKESSVLAPLPRKLKIIRRPDKAVAQPPKVEPTPAPTVQQPVTPPAAAASVEPVRTKKRSKVAAARPSEVRLAETLTVKELSEKINVKSKDVLRELMKRGAMATINQSLDQHTIEEICVAFEVLPIFVTFEESVIEEEGPQDKPEDLTERAPVVTVMGHVDHGKTSLLDAIRKTDVVGGEAGGITQHIGAYHVTTNGKKVVFLDTPGHEAFTLMRARGAQVTDIVVLVVAADDGVMPQTREAIDHARAANVPIIVAINKIDRPDSDAERVKRELSELELVAEDWGGDIIMVEVSATEGTNLEKLLEMILLVAEMQELKANAKRSATGVILEAKLDKGRGAVATVLIQNGGMKVGDPFIAGVSFGKVRAMFDDQGTAVKKVGPSSAVEILGLQGIPHAGDAFQAVEDTAKARQIVDYRIEKEREAERARSSKVSLDDLYSRMQAGEVKELPIVLKADVQGSVEVVADTVQKLSTDTVKIRIIHRGVGAISDTDILLASASQAIVLGFNVRPEQSAQATAEKEEVEVRLYTVIYEVAKEIREAMVGLLEPTLEEVYLGRAEVRDSFKVPKHGIIAGCYVLDGMIRRNAEVRLLRDNVVVFEGRIDSLRRFKDDVNEVRNGYECGISLAGYNDVKLGDVIEAFVKEEVAPVLA